MAILILQFIASYGKSMISLAKNQQVWLYFLVDYQSLRPKKKQKKLEKVTRVDHQRRISTTKWSLASS